MNLIKRILSKLESITLIRIEYNVLNGVIFDLLRINEKSLIGLDIAKGICFIDLFFFSIIQYEEYFKNELPGPEIDDFNSIGLN